MLWLLLRLDGAMAYLLGAEFEGMLGGLGVH